MSELSPNQLDIAERDRMALELRKAGLSFSEIAKRLGYENKSGAWKAVERGLDRWGSDEAEELRQIEAARLDDITVRLWPKVREGDLDAIQTYLRVSERRSRLFGLDAPVHTRLELMSSQEADDTPVAAVEDFERFRDVLGEIIEVEAVEVDEHGQPVEENGGSAE